MKKILYHLNHIEEYICEILLAFFVTLLFVQIITRNIFSYSIAWSDELSTYMFVWFAYLGASVAAKLGAHNRVTSQFNFFPKIVKVVSLVIADLVWMFFNLYFVYLSATFVFIDMNVFWKSQTLGVPMKYVYIVLPIAFSLITIRVAVNTYLLIFKNESPDSPE